MCDKRISSHMNSENELPIQTKPIDVQVTMFWAIRMGLFCRRRRLCLMLLLL